MQQDTHCNDIAACRAAIAALEDQRGTHGDAVVEMATAPLRSRLAGMLRPAGLQRRQVTVLFADVVGSTALAQGLDAEATLDVLSGALRRMAAIIEAHQGRVLRFTGDGVKAAFGMDEAREDDAERAVRAGLAIVEAGREQAEAARRLHEITDFAVRVGVHTGDVALGAGVEADNTAMGAAVNIAARMEQSAPPGALRISHDTWSQVRGLFELEAQPPLQVKGIAAPMQTYLVRAALERGAASVERGLQGLATPMVGRDAELQRLLDAVALARETRQLQALTLVGDAGLGKSRLLRELLAALTAHASADPSGCQILTVRSQPDGLLRPWGLLRSLLAVQCGVADTDSADVARRKVVEGLSPWFAERGERQAQLLGQLSGLDFADSPTVKGLDPRSLRDQALMALRAYLQALAAQGGNLPVLIVEDLHWADDSSLDLLQHLLAHAAELPLALVMTARPPLLARRPEWVQSDAADTADAPVAPVALMTLSPLPADQSNELVQALLQRLGEVPPRLSELIVGRAEGNPYYMEELVRRLIDDGVIAAGGPQWTVQLDRLDTLRLPTTLVGLLQARLDALPTADRQAARQASVIGHVFWDDALQALDASAPQALPALQRAAFVKARDSSDFEGTPERQFDHHLLHQVTYDTLLKAERKLGHALAARWLTERTQGRGAEFLAMTGEHAERAGEAALAIDCFDRAANEARQRSANTAAISWLRRALNLLGDSAPARRLDLLHRLQTICDTLGDRAAQDAALAEMAAIFERHPDDMRHARFLLAQALLADRRGDRAESERHAARAVETAERCGAAEMAAMAHGQMAYLHLARHDCPQARAHIEAGLPWAGKIDYEAARAKTEAILLTVSGQISLMLCRFDEARTALKAGLARGQVLGVAHLQLAALTNLAEVAACLGLWDQSVEWAEGLIAVAQACGDRRAVAMAQYALAQAATAADDHAAAIRCHEQVLPIARATGDRLMQALTLQRLGASHRGNGDLSAARQSHAQSQALFETLDEPIETGVNSACAALCEIGLGRPAAALAMVTSLLERLNSVLAPAPAHTTIMLRWNCQQVLDALGDARATPLLDQLHADVQARAAEMTDLADRDRLIQATPTFRAIVAVWLASAATG